MLVNSVRSCDPRVVRATLTSPSSLRLARVGLLFVLAGCSASIEEPPGGATGSGGQLGAGASNSTAGTGVGNGSGGAGAGAGAGNTNGGNAPGSLGGSGNNVGGSAPGGVPGAGGAPPEPIGPTSLLPARIRRLANAEYDASLHRLLSTQQSPGSGSDFPPDFRQSGFTNNAAQRVDSIIVRRLADAAEALAAEAKQNGTLGRLAPCTNTSQAKTCARSFITSFGEKVYRRALVDDEINALLTLYDVGAEGATYQDGVSHVLRGLLQSAGFLYLTELGAGAPSADGTLNLTARELSAQLSYFLTAAPPDDQLIANADKLSDPAQREAEARRLLTSDALAQDAAIRLVREWLGIDRITSTSKDSLVYPRFEQQKSKIIAESSDFLKALVFKSTGTVKELFSADWTVSSGPLDLYKLAGGAGPVANSSKVDRVGILNQAAFLATYANAHESHPVLRGVAVARRIACVDVPSPTTLNIQVVPPAPDPTKTTRERFDVHSKDNACAACHRIIDPFGFSFEHYDGMGAYRDKDNGKDVDSTVTVALNADFDGAMADSNQLAKELSESEAVRTCFARFMFRAAAATSAETKSEEAFVQAWRSIPAAAQGSILETLIAYVKSPMFAQRRVQ